MVFIIFPLILMPCFWFCGALSHCPSDFCSFRQSLITSHRCFLFSLKIIQISSSSMPFDSSIFKRSKVFSQSMKHTYTFFRWSRHFCNSRYCCTGEGLSRYFAFSKTNILISISHFFWIFAWPTLRNSLSTWLNIINIFLRAYFQQESDLWWMHGYSIH